MQQLIVKGNAGELVDRLRTALAATLGAPAAATFPSLAAAPGSAIDEDFDAAIRRWQSGVGIIADGIVGPRCQVLLGLRKAVPLQLNPPMDVGLVCRLFPATKPANIARYLPYVEAALGAAGLTDRAMVVGALGTIRAETEGFVPIAELQSRFNTPPDGAPFSLYDLRKNLGNGARGDGERYRGRGFVQLTGKANYTTYGKRIGIDLVAFPDRANAPEVAAVVLAQFLADKADKFRAAVLAGNLAAARKLVNGGAHGLASFTDVFKRADAFWPQTAPVTAGRAGAARATRRKPAPAAAAVARDMRTRKDPADLRDRLFQPVAITLPDAVPTPDDVSRFLPGYTGAGLILNQGGEGACTGFGLSCVINYLRWIKAKNPKRMESVSPRMLYTLARQHDEYDGENYDGSSCRGALKGWFNNGVCLESDWPYVADQSDTARYGFADRAAQHTVGVYYRVDTKSITDMQAAIHQHRAVFASAFTHDGWDAVPERKTAPKSHDDLPRIAFDGRPSQTQGHAFALVGYNADGFIVQNSWGTGWGTGGFAVLTYLDWLANGMDAWVVALGVPGVISGRLAVDYGQAGALAGADRSKWWDKGLAYQHSVVLGNDGRVRRYLTQDAQPRKLQHQCTTLPDAWFRTQPDAKKRLVLYVHGGLNSEDGAIERASAMGRFFVANGCYPLFLVWKTGLIESLGDILSDSLQRQPAMAGAGEWLSEKTDKFLEKTIGRPFAKPIWSEMKENAGLAYEARHGGDLLLDALQGLSVIWGDALELHLVGHSAGAIALGHLLATLKQRKDDKRDSGLHDRLASVHLYAPACSVAFANQRYARNPHVMERLHLDVLSDRVERRDTVGKIYRKSLLYFVSNALETDLRLPILGLDRIHDASYNGWDGTSDTGEALAGWRAAAAKVKLARRTTVLDADRVTTALDASGKPLATTDTAHGSFDNDVEVVTRTLLRIRGGEPLLMPVDDLRGY